MRRSRIALALGAALLAGCGGTEGEDAGKAAVVGVNVGNTAPAYAAAALDGKPVSLQGLRGAPVLLNVWATWCAPCRKEIPALQRLHQEYAGRGLRIVGVSVDAEGEENAVAEFAKGFGVTYTIWLDPDEAVTSTFRTIGVPTTLLVDRQGKILWRHMGPVSDTDPQLRKLVEGAL